MVPQAANMNEIIDKIDMSLDDIIRLNKEQQNKAAFNGGSKSNSFQWFRNNWSSRRAPGNQLQGKRNGTFGVKTGLALRKMASWKGMSPLNRPPLGLRNSDGQWSPFRRRTNLSRRLGFAPSVRRNYFNSSYSQTSSFRRGLRTNQQRDQRQATFFQKRGLKVQTSMDMDQLEELPELNRTYPKSKHNPAPPRRLFSDPLPDISRPDGARLQSTNWRTSMNSSGILTVSIDNPTAAVLPSTRLPRPPLPFLLKKDGSEPKVPKGVPLDFDINSVVKQTGITLNERFKILKEQRLSQAMSKGSRFVTVG